MSDAVKSTTKPSLEEASPFLEELQKRLKEWMTTEKKPEAKPIVKEASLMVGDERMDYSVECGLQENQTEKKDTRAKIFYCYYKKKNALPQNRH